MSEVKTIFTIYAPVSLMQRVGAMAQERGQSRNLFVVGVLKAAVKENEKTDPDRAAKKRSPRG